MKSKMWKMNRQPQPQSQGLPTQGGGRLSVQKQVTWSTLGSPQELTTKKRGGGSNYLCLPKEQNAVVYSKSLNYKSKAQKYSLVYGTEYEKPLNGEDDSNAPCAVCQSTKPNTLMIPGSYIQMPWQLDQGILWLPYVWTCHTLQDHFRVCGQKARSSTWKSRESTR